jgi:hypothetical protein
VFIVERQEFCVCPVSESRDDPVLKEVVMLEGTILFSSDSPVHVELFRGTVS